MSNLLLFPSPSSATLRSQPSTSPAVTPNYAGRLLTLNPEKARTFQCGGFILGPRIPSAVVEPEAQMDQIARGLADGRLLDITDNTEVASSSGTRLTAFDVPTDTGMKAYLTRQEDGSTVLFFPKDEEEQAAIEAQLENGTKLILPEGFGDEEKYLIRLDQSNL